KIAINVFAFGRQSVGLGKLDDEVGRAQSPALRPFWQARQISGSSFDRAFGNPAADRLNLIGAQRAVIGEIAVAFFWQPGGHVTFLDDFDDLFGVFARVLISEQVKRGRLRWAMAE